MLTGEKTTPVHGVTHQELPNRFSTHFGAPIHDRIKPKYLAACIFLALGTSNVNASSDASNHEPVFATSHSTLAATSKETLSAPKIEHCENLLTHADPVSIAPLHKPPHMRLYLDPAFTTKNRRITNSLDGQVHKPIGNSAQSWNSDESLLMLQSYDEDKTSKFILMDGSTYQRMGDLNISTPVDNSVYWSRENPLSVLYVSGSEDKAGHLLRFDIASGTESLIKDFSPYCEQNGFTATGGMFPKPSSNDDLFSFQCGSESNKSLVVSYRYLSDEIHTLNIGEGSRWELNQPPVSTSSGEKFLFQGFTIDDTLKGSIVKLNTPDSEFPYLVSQNSAGDDVAFQIASNTDSTECPSSDALTPGIVFKHNLQNNECNSFLTQGEKYTIDAAGSYLFADAEHAPDLAAMSSIGYGKFDHFSKDTPAPTLLSELFLINTDSTDAQEVCRIAHHRTFGKHAQNANYEAHLGEPTLSMSPSGSRVLFSSDWYDSGSVDTYVVELPTFTRLQIDGGWADHNRPSMVTQFAQAGAKFAFRRETTDTAGEKPAVATGTGQISGKQIDLDYVTTVSNKKIKGKCSAAVKRDVDNLVFSCDDVDAGLSDFTIVRQRMQLQSLD